MNKISFHNIIYNSGDIFLPKKIKNLLEIAFIGSTKKTFYVSGWSIVHFINGIIFGYIYLYFKWDRRLYFYNLFTLHNIWEFWQILIGMSKPYKLTGHNNLIDIIMDTIFFMLGTYIIYQYKYKLTAKSPI